MATTTTTTIRSRSSRSTASTPPKTKSQTQAQPVFEFYGYASSPSPASSPELQPQPQTKRPSRSASTSKPSFEYAYHGYSSATSSSPEPHVQHHREHDLGEEEVHHAHAQAQTQPSLKPQRRPSVARSASSSTAAQKPTTTSSFEYVYHGFNSTSQQHAGRSTSTSPPSRSNSTDSLHNHTHHHRHRSTSPSPPVPPIPANAFNIMHDWEIESLEKWQRRLDRIRQNQSHLRSRIASLVKEERELWARYDEQVPPNSVGRGGMSAEYAEWVAFLEGELAGLREELEGTLEAEEKAERGVRKASARLEEIRVLGGRWKTGATAEQPDSARTKSRSRSGSGSGSTPSRSATPAPESHHHRTRPTRSNTDPLPASASRSPSPAQSKSDPTRNRSSSSTRSASPNSNSNPKYTTTTVYTTYISRGRPLQPSSQKTSLNPWLAYEDKWHQLLTNSSSVALTFKTMPWPMASPPTCPGDIKMSAIRSFIFSPNAVKPHLSGAGAGGVGGENSSKSRRAVLRAAILRWHPDKFVGRYLGCVVDEDKEVVKEGVEMVIRGLNEIMRLEAVKERSA